MGKDTAVGLERLLKALANRRRIAIMRFLKARSRASVGEIADEIKLSFKATSKHLAVLTAADLVEREQQSLNMIYRVSDELGAAARATLSIL